MKKGICKKSFSDPTFGVRGVIGEPIDVPEGADWVAAGLVEITETDPPPPPPDPELTDIDGIGAKTAAKLADLGIDSLRGLVRANTQEVADALEGVSTETVSKWQAAAEELWLK